MRLDMHFHSTVSDGTEKPEKLARMGARSGLKVMALTDHDTIDGVPLFLKECDRLGVVALSGIEMSAQWPTTLHLTGYNFDVNDPALQKKLNGLQEEREDRNDQMLKKCKAQGLQITYSDVQQESKGGVIGRPHFAKALIRKGYISTIKEAFEKYLGADAPCYVPRQNFPPQDCIDMIAAAGGQVCLAHPYVTGTLEELEDLLPSLIEAGLWGVECYSGHHDAAASAALVRLARGHGLGITAGSDFHGANRPNYQLGVTMPDELFQWTAFGLLPPTFEGRRKR